MKPVWIDTHAHLDDPAFDPDREEVITAAQAANVVAIVNIGYRPSAWGTTLALARCHRSVSCALGIHPAHADEFSPATFEALSRAVEMESPAAIGEIGLDFFRNGPPRLQQEDALRHQLRFAATIGLPAVIHQRAAESELVAVLEAEPVLPCMVLHSFDGSDRYASFARERACLVGVGGLATRKSAWELRKILATLDPARVVLETDAPYLAPATVRERRNVPENIPLIAQQLAPLWSMTAEELASQTTATAAATFRLRVQLATAPE